MGLADFLEEFTKQMEQWSRENIDGDVHDPDPAKTKRNRALRRQKAWNKVPKPDPEPDLDGMRKDALEILHDETKIEIKQLKRQLNRFGDLTERSRQREKPGSRWEGASDAIRSLGEVALDKQIVAKRKLLAAIKVKLRSKAVPPASLPRRTRQLSKQAKNAKLMIRVEKERDQVIAAAKKAGASPETLKSIQQMFRQKLDEVRDS
jgi:hypothetical protein